MERIGLRVRQGKKSAAIVVKNIAEWEIGCTMHKLESLNQMLIEQLDGLNEERLQCWVSDTPLNFYFANTGIQCGPTTFATAKSWVGALACHKMFRVCRGPRGCTISVTGSSITKIDTETS